MKNIYEVKGNEAIIHIKYKGHTVYATVDMGDFNKVNGYPGTWTVIRNTNVKECIYAAMGHKDENGKFTMSLMHRIIMDNPEGKFIDHINHDTLNNKKENLRIVTPSQNQQNRKGAMKNSKTGIRGVYLNKQTNRWVAEIKLGGKKVWNKTFEFIEDAEREIEKARPIYHTHARPV
jgi:hypothetical protein